MKNNASNKVNLLIEDFRAKQHLFNNFTQWRILKQIECFCQTNEVAVPNSVSFTIKVHEIAAKRDGAFLDNWDDGMDYISWKKSTNVSDGACMFFEQDKFFNKKLAANRENISNAAIKNRTQLQLL